VANVPETIVYIAKLMFDRQLTDIAGGNVSCREGEWIYMTPTRAGQKRHWDLRQEEILCAPVGTDELLENPKHSKEAISHLLVYRAYPQVTGIIHAHPFHVMPFCAAGKPIPAVIKSAQVYGDEFGFIEEAPMYSHEQGKKIVAGLRPYKARMKQFAGIVLMYQHGIFIAAGNLYQAIDCLERMNTNAYCNLSLKLID
jgi:L-fuculose-phosphate aldolase